MEVEKLETSIAKEEKRVKQEAKKADSQKQKAVDAFAVVTTVLLVFEKSDPDLKEAGATGKKAKKQYAMTLWSDGPNVVPFSNFRGLKSTFTQLTVAVRVQVLREVVNFPKRQDLFMLRGTPNFASSMLCVLHFARTEWD